MRSRKLSKGYSFLQSIVPSLLPKASKERIVDGTIEYIRELEKEKSVLEELKHSRSNIEANSMLSTITNQRSSVQVTVSGNVAFFGIEVNFRQSLASKILKVFDKYGVEILAANVAVDEDRHKLMVTVTVNVGSNEIIETIRRAILIV